MNALAVTPQLDAWQLPENRRRMAAQALQAGDRDALYALLEVYVSLYGRSGAKTSPRTLEAYWRGASLFLDWCQQGAVMAHQVRDGAFFLASINLAPKSKKLYMTGARVFVKALRWAGMGEGDPFAGLTVRNPQRPEDTIKLYSEAEVEQLLSTATQRERVIVRLAYDAALRLAEAVALQWEDVDFSEWTMRVTGKGGRVTKIGLTAKLLDGLLNLGPAHGPVLGISRRRVEAILEDLCKRAGVPRRGYHALRHSCATRMFRNTKNIMAVQHHLRHSDPRTTTVYVHLNPDDYTAAVASLDANGH